MDMETIIYLKRIAEALEQIARQMSADKPYPAQTPLAAVQEVKNHVPTPDAGSNNALSFIPATISTDMAATMTAGESSDTDCGRIREQSPQTVIDMLDSIGVSVKNYATKNEEQQEVYNIAKFMGDRYSDIHHVYERLKRDLCQQTGFTLNMRTYTQQEVAASCQLCTSLYRIAFLANYKYVKSPAFNLYAQAPATNNQQAINFLTGHWLELFVRDTILEVLASMGGDIEYSYIVNPQVCLPNGDDFELDVIFLINGKTYWVEAKTGNYQQYISKYAKLAKELGLDPYIVLADMSVRSTTVQTLSATYGIHACFVEDFREMFRRRIEQDLIIEKNNTLIP